MKILHQRWEAKVAKGSGCWLWTASTNQSGYGLLGVPTGISGKWLLVLAHRYAYEYFVGPIPLGMLVLHSCDHPPCCNPDHLRLGSKADHSHDAMLRKRRPVKLTTEQVAETYRYYAVGVQQKELASQYRVCPQNICFIIQEQTRSISGDVQHHRSIQWTT